ncbi:MAG TPA: elongation factor 4, partial [Clostridiales bacterium]|nr:elongation factor 4 [Clostridiales bacterium]
MSKQENIRNFCIVAHIDHGKSTLADRLLEMTHTVSGREMEEQVLDNMDLERERGITIKARAVRLEYIDKEGQKYAFNLIDTPGHVDFNYEVSRSLSACEGALLVVDATQGIQAQTLANGYLAFDAGLEIIPVINKVDLPAADVDETRHEIEEIVGIPADEAPCISAKTGLNIEAVLDAVIRSVPAPKGDPFSPAQALIFDAVYDSYKGVIVYVRMKEGTLKKGQTIRMMATGAEYEIVEIGYLRPLGLEQKESLEAGEVGFLTAAIKTLSDAQVGDTITTAEHPASQPLPGYKKALPMVYSGVYPADGSHYGDLRDALDKLILNDASLVFEPDTSVALGFGFRCGYLGLLHMEIVLERLEREFNLDLITTAPSVIYQLQMTNGQTVMIDNPTNYPPSEQITAALEPMVKASIILPTEFVGSIMDLCQDRRGVLIDLKYLGPDRVELHYHLPLNEIIYDFFDAL